MRDSRIHDLVTISSAIGHDIALIQGGGGNTSVKDGAAMAIKASGSILSELSATQGFSVVDYGAIRNLLRQPGLEEDDYASRVKSFVIATENRPSIETGFHALLGRNVIHSHSVYANLLTCSKEGAALAHRLFPKAIWVEYAAPGLSLTLKVQEKLDETSLNLQDDIIIFLENHGLLVSAETVEDVIALHAQVNRTIREALDVPESAFQTHKKSLPIQFLKENILFPDQVVYLMGGERLINTVGGQENIQAYDFIYNQLLLRSMEPNFLSPEDGQYLLDMESEKYRQQVIK